MTSAKPLQSFAEQLAAAEHMYPNDSVQGLFSHVPSTQVVSVKTPGGIIAGTLQPMMFRFCSAPIPLAPPTALSHIQVVTFGVVAFHHASRFGRG